MDDVATTSEAQHKLADAIVIPWSLRNHGGKIACRIGHSRGMESTIRRGFD